MEVSSSDHRDRRCFLCIIRYRFFTIYFYNESVAEIEHGLVVAVENEDNNAPSHARNYVAYLDLCSSRLLRSFSYPNRVSLLQGRTQDFSWGGAQDLEKSTGGTKLN